MIPFLISFLLFPLKKPNPPLFGTLTDLLQLATRSRRNLLIPHKAMPSNAKS
jgi:hypothetical protein